MSKSSCRILENSVSLFKQKGFNATTVSDIAASAGMLKGSLYNHFKSKEDILIQVIEDVEVQFFKKLQFHETKDFELILSHIADFFIENECCLMANLLNESLPELPHAKITSFFSNWKLQLVDHMDSKIPLNKRVQFAEDIIIGFEGSVIIKRINRNNDAVFRYLEGFVKQYRELLL